MVRIMSCSLSLTAMESPVSFQADAVRNEQAKVLHSIQPLDSEDVLQRVFAASTAKACGGERVRPIDGTRSRSESRTETFVALKLNIDNWRWAGVPFLSADREAPGAAPHRDCYSIQTDAV